MCVRVSSDEKGKIPPIRRIIGIELDSVGRRIRATPLFEENKKMYRVVKIPRGRLSLSNAIITVSSRALITYELFKSNSVYGR